MHLTNMPGKMYRTVRDDNLDIRQVLSAQMLILTVLYKFE